MVFASPGDNTTLSESTIQLDGGTGAGRLGGNGVAGGLALQATNGDDRIRLEGAEANAWLGGNGADGDLVLFANSGDNATLAESTIHLNGGAGDITLGGNGVSGNLTIRDPAGENRAELNANGNLLLGGNGADGDVFMFPPEADGATVGLATIHLEAETANLRMGGGGTVTAGQQAGQDGDITLQSREGLNRIHLDAGAANGFFGGNGVDGDLALFAELGDNATIDQATIHLDGELGNLRMGGSGQNGDVILRGDGGEDRIRLDAGAGNLFLGGNGEDGDIFIFDDSGDNATAEDATIHLNGQAGDIILRNADCAEEFDLVGDDATPGTVVVIGGDGRLRASTGAYDRRVAGVVSGAGRYRPGILLDRQPAAPGRGPVALVGKVYCKVDSAFGAIEVGDLLTTSPTPGHAMRAADATRSFGAVIGKALGRHASGQGLIPVLVAMQ